MRLFPATEPFSGLAMDLLGPLPTSENGFRFILVICDRFTKLTRVFPLRETTALVIASVFLDHWVGAYGFPDTVLTDNGPQFAAVFLQGVMGMIGVITNFTTPYQPQTNGQVESFNLDPGEPAPALRTGAPTNVGSVYHPPGDCV